MLLGPKLCEKRWITVGQYSNIILEQSIYVRYDTLPSLHISFLNCFVQLIESLLPVQFCVDRELQNKDKVLIRSTEVILKKPGTARLG